MAEHRQRALSTVSRALSTVSMATIDNECGSENARHQVRSDRTMDANRQRTLSTGSLGTTVNDIGSENTCTLPVQPTSKNMKNKCTTEQNEDCRECTSSPRTRTKTGPILSLSNNNNDLSSEKDNHNVDISQSTDKRTHNVDYNVALNNDNNALTHVDDSSSQNMGYQNMNRIKHELYQNKTSSEQNQNLEILSPSLGNDRIQGIHTDGNNRGSTNATVIPGYNGTQIRPNNISTTSRLRFCPKLNIDIFENKNRIGDAHLFFENRNSSKIIRMDLPPNANIEVVNNANIDNISTERKLISKTNKATGNVSGANSKRPTKCSFLSKFSIGKKIHPEMKMKKTTEIKRQIPEINIISDNSEDDLKSPTNVHKFKLKDSHNTETCLNDNSLFASDNTTMITAQRETCSHNPIDIERRADIDNEIEYKNVHQKTEGKTDNFSSNKLESFNNCLKDDHVNNNANTKTNSDNFQNRNKDQRDNGLSKVQVTSCHVHDSLHSDFVNKSSPNVDKCNAVSQIKKDLETKDETTGHLIDNNFKNDIMKQITNCSSHQHQTESILFSSSQQQKLKVPISNNNNNISSNISGAWKPSEISKHFDKYTNSTNSSQPSQNQRQPQSSQMSTLNVNNSSQLVGKVRPQSSTELRRRPRSKSSSRLSTTTSINITLLTVNVMFWLLNAPIVIFIIGYTYWIEGADDRKRAQLDLVWTTVNLLQYTNNACHVFMYCLTGPRFRKQLVVLVKKMASLCYKKQ